MPKLNPSGAVLAGVAGVPSSIDGVQIPVPGVQGDWCWWNGPLALGQKHLGGEDYQLYDSQDRLVENRGAFFLAASGTGAYRTERSGNGLGRPIAGAEGYIAAIDDYQAGRGLTVYRDDGSKAYQTGKAIGAPPSRNCAIRNGLLSFFGDGQWQIVDLTDGQPWTFTPRPEVDWLVPGVISGVGVILLERADSTGLTLRRADDPTKLQTVTTYAQGLIFNPDLVILNGQCRVTWSLTQGEEIPNVRTQDVAFTGGGTVPVPPDPQPPTDCEAALAESRQQVASLEAELRSARGVITAAQAVICDYHWSDGRVSAPSGPQRASVAPQSTVFTSWPPPSSVPITFPPETPIAPDTPPRGQAAKQIAEAEARALLAKYGPKVAKIILDRLKVRIGKGR